MKRCLRNPEQNAKFRASEQFSCYFSESQLHLSSWLGLEFGLGDSGSRIQTISALGMSNDIVSVNSKKQKRCLELHS